MLPSATIPAESPSSNHMLILVRHIVTGNK
jgi:hypothetical protein